MTLAQLFAGIEGADRVLGEIAGRAVEAAIDEWNPVGPEATDQLLRRKAKGIAGPAVQHAIEKLIQSAES